MTDFSTAQLLEVRPGNQEELRMSPGTLMSPADAKSCLFVVLSARSHNLTHNISKSI